MSSRIRAPIMAAIAITVVFLALALLQGNLEFLFYVAALAVITALLHFTDARFNYRNIALWGFALWALLHLLGGMVQVNGENLYGLVLIDLVGDPYGILRYDQVVHTFCYVVAALIFGSLVENLSAGRAGRGLAILVTVLAATGVGALNEIIEFTAFVVVADTGVGGYVNNAIDLVANLIGALIGACWYFRAR